MFFFFKEQYELKAFLNKFLYRLIFFLKVKDDHAEKVKNNIKTKLIQQQIIFCDAAKSYSVVHKNSSRSLT